MAGVQRLRDALDRPGGKLSIYLAAGHPDLAASPDYFDAAIAGGADFLEVGIPFSDPAADGPVIEAATAAAVQAGVTVADCLALAAGVRARHPNLPLVAMTYGNLAYQRTWTGWANALADAGIDGCILADIPLEESAPVRAALADAGVAWIPLVTPATPPERMAATAATATGFLYVVSSLGITGQGDPGALLEATVATARTAAPDVPLVVGFGIKSAADVQRVWDAGADGAIIGSHVVKAISADATPAEVQAMVRALHPTPGAATVAATPSGP